MQRGRGEETAVPGPRTAARSCSLPAARSGRRGRMEVVRSSESSAGSNPSPDGNQPLHRQHDQDRGGGLHGLDSSDDDGESGHRRVISIEGWIILEFGVSKSAVCLSLINKLRYKNYW